MSEQSSLLKQIDELIKKFNNKRNSTGKDTKCSRLQRLINTLQQQNDDMYTNDYTLIVDDYVHALLEHNNDNDFEYIHNQVGFCDIYECAAAHRNYLAPNKNQTLTENAPMQQIMDKIHCYYAHTYDIGYRLNEYQRQSIYNLDKEHKFNEYQVHDKLLKINQLLNKKQTFIHLNHRHQTKLNQLGNTTTVCVDKNMYSFGYKFKYGYVGEKKHSGTKPFPVFARYSSLKEELTTNAIRALSIVQFNTEYKKAQIHYASEYCKTTFVPYVYNNVKWIFYVEHVLSLMIYCNYTELQYYFSKTYRNNGGSDHNNFYHLAATLKIAIHQFGQTMSDNQIKTFYHGISEQVTFSKYGNVSIFCPLSTTSSFTVAINFTNNNNGMIVEFDGNKSLNLSISFSVSWLSNYPNENEHVFIQNGYGLRMDNIYMVRFGYQFNCILQNIARIHEIIHNQEIERDVDPQVKDLMIEIMQNKQQIKTYDKYAINIIKSYFEGQRQIRIDYAKWKNNTCLFAAFCLTEYEWIRTKGIMLLCPNAKRLNVMNVDLCSKTLNHIFSDLKQNACTLQKIGISGITENNMNIQKFKYRMEKIKNVNCRVRVECYDDQCDIYINYEQKVLEPPQEPESDESSD